MTMLYLQVPLKALDWNYKARQLTWRWLWIKKEIIYCELMMYMYTNQVSISAIDVKPRFTLVLNLGPWPQWLSFVALWSQVLNPMLTLSDLCPWNWNFLVYHRVPFQQASTQLSFNHSPRSYCLVGVQGLSVVVCYTGEHSALLWLYTWNVFKERNQVPP